MYIFNRSDGQLCISVVNVFSRYFVHLLEWAHKKTMLYLSSWFYKNETNKPVLINGIDAVSSESEPTAKAPEYWLMTQIFRKRQENIIFVYVYGLLRIVAFYTYFCR